MVLEMTTSYLQDSVHLLQYYKRLAERSMEQCPDAGLFATLDAESNSIAIIVKHMAGNMRSRWTNFLTTDGEKPDRDRDSEFEEPVQTRNELSVMWEQGWHCVFDTLAGLTDSDMDRIVAIRGERHSVMQAVHRQVSHYSYHVGQIVFLAKHFAADAGAWKALTVPRNQSDQFTADVLTGRKSQR